MPEYLPFPPGMKDILLLSIGAALSGANFHAHNSSWCFCIRGQKLWLLYPPGRIPANMDDAVDEAQHCPASLIAELSARDDRHEGPASQDGLVCFIQNAGEIVCLPPNWHHAVVNLAPTTVAVVHVLEEGRYEE